MNRRLFLRATGAAVALPFLQSALPRRSWGQAFSAPPRLVFWYVPNGIQTPWWQPDTIGPGYDLKDITLPLEPVQAKVSVISGLANVQAEDVVPGDHARGTGSFLTCVPIRRTAGNDIENGVSADQVAASAKGDETMFPSLQIGIAPGGNTGDCTAGYSCAYTRNISWSGPRQPLPNVTDPRVLFDRMFGVDQGLDPETKALRARMRSSVLDQVLDQATVLDARLGVDDRARLDQYLTAVREVEVRVSALGGGACSASDPPPSEAAFPEHVAIMNELVAVALQCDLTRIVTFMLGEAASNQTFDFVGVPGAHHQISHHQNDPKNLADLVTIANWEVARFADLVARLDSVADGGGTLLDASLLLFSSEVEDGDKHLHRNLPVLLAGRGNGTHEPGRHIHYDQNRPFADLLLTMLQSFGVETDRFGADGRTPLQELAG